MVRLLKMPWFPRLGRQRVQRPQGPDLADMGTCFALDATFEAGSASAPACAPTQGLTQVPATLGNGWAEDRLNGRSVI